MFAIRCFAAAICGIASAVAAVEVAAQSPSAVQSGAVYFTHTDSSSLWGEKRTVRVVPPAGYAMATRRYPVLILLDANDEPQFAAAVANVAFLASQNAIPPMLIVGIENGRNRVYDLTPEPRTGTVPSAATGGGGPRFIEYVEREVLPMIRERYRAAPYTVFAGHSLGGLMAVYVAASHPSLASAVIAMSPSLWINDEAATPRYVRSIAVRTTPVRIFTARGAFEPSIDSTTRHFSEQLARALRGRPNAMVQARQVRYDADSHNLTQLASLVDGLRWVFADYSKAETQATLPDGSRPIDSLSAERAARATERIYARAEAAFPSSQLGSTPLPEGLMPAEVYVSLASTLTTLKQSGAGLNIFKRVVAAYPEDARVHRALGRMRLARGDTTLAIADLEKALSLAPYPPRAISDH